MKALISAAVISISLGAVASAHVDDSGDIHPQVTVEDGHFAIYFRNTPSRETLRTKLGRDGEVLKQRETVPGFPAEPLPLKLPKNEPGINLPQLDAYYVVPKYSRGLEERFVLRLKNGEKTRIDLEWPAGENAGVEGAAFTDDFLILAASDMPARSGDPVFFYAFARESWEVQREEPIGNPIRIYGMPRASHVVVSGGHAYLAWMAREPDNGVALNLSEFDPSTGRIKTKRISGGHWNSSPSMAVMDGQIAIAFHKTESVLSHGGDAKIIVNVHSLQAIFPEHQAEEDGAREPATAPDLNSEGNDKPEPESEGRSQ